MSVVDNGVRILLNRAYDDSSNTQSSKFKVGEGSTAATSTDSTVSIPIPISGSTSIDACDATAGFTAADSCASLVLNQTAGQYKEGTGCINLVTDNSADFATVYKTIASTNLSSKYVYVWFYIDDKSTQLTNATNSVRISLGTGGFTNYNYYDFAYSTLSDGWNLIYCDVDNETGTGGTGADETDVDRIRLQFRDAAAVTGTDARMDYWHYATYAQITKDYEATFPQINYTNKTVTQRLKLSSTQGNGYNIREFGTFNTDTTPLLETRDTITSFSKSSTDELIINNVITVDNS